MTTFQSSGNRFLPMQTENNRKLMSPFRRGTYILSVLAGLFCLFGLYALLPQPPTQRRSSPVKTGAKAATSFDGNWNPARDSLNLLLNDGQCTEAFSGLFADINRAIEDRGGMQVSVAELERVPRINGYVRGMIYNQELFIIDKQGGIYSRELATLSALHRAIITSPEPLPNVEFTFNSDDRVGSTATWAYARRAEDKALWLIPDFGFWSWPETKVGSYTMVQQKAIILEDGDTASGHPPLPFSSKQDRLVWRGATMSLPLREKFLAETVGRSWSDVKEIKWHDAESISKDLLSMEDHCKYKFVAHTEGNSYSGRLKYLQNYRSVTIAHTMDWIQHHQHLMRSFGPEQNYVEVHRNFSDLDEKMNYLISHSREAEKIADNSVRTFRERYLTPAAEACYWRKLIRAWASVSFEPKRWDSTGQLRGVSFEDYILERRLEWQPY